MIKVFIPEIKGRNKTNIRGFWLSPEGKVYYDYLRIINTYNLNTWILEDLKNKYNQKALFYVRFNCGYVYNGINKQIDVLPNRIYAEVLKTNLKQEIKEALQLYGGVTIYKEDNKYFKEIFYK
jgi:hypothetical protein